MNIPALEKIAFSLFTTNETIPFFGLDLDTSKWGKGVHDENMANEDEIITPRVGESIGNISTNTQAVPDKWINFVSTNPIYSGVTSMMNFPPPSEVSKILQDPTDEIDKFLTGSKKLPQNWGEFSESIDKPFLVPEDIWAPVTNSLHYAMNPILTGKVTSSDLKSRHREIAGEIARRFNKAMKRK